MERAKLRQMEVMVANDLANLSDSALGVKQETPSVTDRLEQELARVCERKTELESALEILKSSPETQKVLDALAMVGQLHQY